MTRRFMNRLFDPSPHSENHIGGLVLSACYLPPPPGSCMYVTFFLSSPFFFSILDVVKFIDQVPALESLCLASSPSRLAATDFPPLRSQ